MLYAPAAQRSHEGAPPALNEPAAQTRHADELPALGLYVPAAQGRHELMETPALKLYVPAAQLVQVDEPLLLQEPGPQDTQHVEPVTQEDPNLPAVQLVQDDDALEAAYFPKAQDEQAVAPPALNVPGEQEV